MGFYIPEDVILHIHRRENLKSYIIIELVTDIYIYWIIIKTDISNVLYKRSITDIAKLFT
jgi:hypothetical protein